MTKELFEVSVRGGALTVARWPGEGPVVLALHGVTANHVAFTKVAERLGGDVTLVAPDLRGRAGSYALPGPYGMAAHAADAAAVIAAVGAGRCLVVGHSMGGFVAATLAELHPDLVSSLILVDGGVEFGIEAPPGADLDALIEQVIGPAMTRLSTTFSTREAYRDFWRAHPAFKAPAAWGPATEEYIQYDLAPEGPPWRSRVSVDAVRGDSADTLARRDAYTAYARVSCPTVWMRAERGLFDQVPPLYPDERAREILAKNPHLSDVFVAEVNHYTLTLSDHGAEAVAEQIRKAARV